MNATLSARTVRLKKEVRALFWPWCATLLSGASPIVLPHRYGEPLSFISFFIGVPLLAMLSLGNEFHHHTFTLWLSQPLSRTELWAEKMIVMFPAVLSAGLVSGVVMFLVTWPDMRSAYKVAAVLYVLFFAASATYGALSTRSPIGGLVLISTVLFFGSLFSGGLREQPRSLVEPFSSSFANAAFLSTLGLCCAAWMLWLGLRKLARFQYAGGPSEGDLMTSGPALLPEAVARFFRCRPRGLFLNLVRKEFRLLRPLWLIAFVIFAYVACLAIFRLLPAPPVGEPRTVLEWALLGPLVSVCIAMAGLAGILSLGEERTSGTHAWQMTLPVSSRRQWLIKLLVAMFAGLGSSLVFPVLAMVTVGAVYGSPLMYVNVHTLPDLLVIFAILTFTCFWCACATNGTVRAAVWAFPASAVVALACGAGLWLGDGLTNASGTLRDFLVSSFHLDPFSFAAITEYARQHFLWLFVPTLLFALFQSFWLFRAPSQSGVRWIVRCFLPLAAVTVLWSFSASAGFLYSRWEPFQETRQALDRLQPMAAPLKLTAEQLTNDSSLSPLTRQWLTHAQIDVAPQASPATGYRATIHLASGIACRLTVLHQGWAAAASCEQAP